MIFIIVIMIVANILTFVSVFKKIHALKKFVSQNNTKNLFSVFDYCTFKYI